MADTGASVESILSMVGPMLATMLASNRPLASSALYGVNPGAAASNIIQPVSAVSQLANFLLGTPQNNSMSPLSRIGSAPLSTIQAMQAKDNDLRFRQLQWAATKDAYMAGMGMSDAALRNWGVGDTSQFRKTAEGVKGMLADSAVAPFVKQYGSVLALRAASQFGMFTDDANRAAFGNRQQFSRGGMYNAEQAAQVNRAAQRDLEQIRAFQSTGDISGKIESLLPDTRFTRGFSDMQLLQQRSFLRARGVLGLRSSSGLDAMAGAYKDASGMLGTSDVNEISQFIDRAAGNGLTGTRVQDIQKAFRNLTTLATTLNVQVAGFSETVLRLQQGSATAGGLSGAALAAGGGGLAANNAITGGGVAMAARLSYMATKNGISNEQMQAVFLAQKDDFRRSQMGRTLAYYNMQPDKTTYERLKAVALSGNAGAWDKAMQGALAATFGSYTAGKSALSDVRLQERMFGSWNQEEEGLVTMGARNAARRAGVAADSARAREKAAVGAYGAYASPLEAQNVRATAIIGALSGLQRQMAERAFAGGGARQLDDLLRTQAFADVRTDAETAGRIGLAKHLETKFGDRHAEYGAVNAMSALASPTQKKELQAIASAMRMGGASQAQMTRLAAMRADPLMRAAWDAHMDAARTGQQQSAARRLLEDGSAALDKLIGGKAENDALFAAAAKNNTAVTLSGTTIAADQVQKLSQYRKEILFRRGSAEEQYNLGQDSMIDEAKLARTFQANEAHRRTFEASNPGIYDSFKQSFGRFAMMGDQKSLGALIGNDQYAPMLSLFNKLAGGEGGANVAALRDIGSDRSFAEYERRTGGKGALTADAFKAAAAQRDTVLRGALAYQSSARDIFEGTYDDYVAKNSTNRRRLSQEDWSNGRLFMELDTSEADNSVSKPNSGKSGAATKTAELELIYDGKPVVGGKVQVSLHIDTSNLPAGAMS